MTTKEKIAKLYEAMWCEELHIWIVIQRLNENISLCLDWEYDMKPSDEFIWLFLKRKDYNKPIPLGWWEEWKDVVDYIYSLII